MWSLNLSPYFKNIFKVIISGFFSLSGNGSLTAPGPYIEALLNFRSSAAVLSFNFPV